MASKSATVLGTKTMSTLRGKHQLQWSHVGRMCLMGLQKWISWVLRVSKHRYDGSHESHIVRTGPIGLSKIGRMGLTGLIGLMGLKRIGLKCRMGLMGHTSRNARALGSASAVSVSAGTT